MSAVIRLAPAFCGRGGAATSAPTSPLWGGRRGDRSEADPGGGFLHERTPTPTPPHKGEGKARRKAPLDGMRRGRSPPTDPSPLLWGRSARSAGRGVRLVPSPRHRYLPHMTKLEQIEKSIATLSDEEIKQLAAWFDELRGQRWDRQIEEDAKAGRLDKLADEALADHRAGKTRPL